MAFSICAQLILSPKTPLTPSIPSLAPSWKWLWKIPTIPKILSFLWLACHERLPTEDLLHNRQDDPCPLYHVFMH